MSQRRNFRWPPLDIAADEELDRHLAVIDRWLRDWNPSQGMAFSAAPEALGPEQPGSE